MKITTSCGELFRFLQQVIGAVQRRHTLPILANVLVVAKDDELTLTATDMEVELAARAELSVEEAGEVTMPARKLLDILHALPEGAAVTLTVDNDKVQIRCGRSRFTLITLPAADFPALEDIPFEGSLRLSQRALKTIIERTHFAMAQQDVRYYLNGLLLEAKGNHLCAVATDGHRLALCDTLAEVKPEAFTGQVILPRKGVQELLHLLSDSETEVQLKIGTNHLQATIDNIRFTSKLIDGKFPDYRRIIPHEGDLIIHADRLMLRNALARAAILSDEKCRGVRLQAGNWLLHIQAHNPEQEESEESIDVNYSGVALEVGFNVTYLLDALGSLSGELVKLSFTDIGRDKSCLIQEMELESGMEKCKCVIMPMRL